MRWTNHYELLSLIMSGFRLAYPRWFCSGILAYIPGSFRLRSCVHTSVDRDPCWLRLGRRRTELDFRFLFRFICILNTKNVVLIKKDLCWSERCSGSGFSRIMIQILQFWPHVLEQLARVKLFSLTTKSIVLWWYGLIHILVHILVRN